MTAWGADRVLAWAWVGIAALLACATFLARVFHCHRPSPETQKTNRRIRTWWGIAGCLCCAMSFGAVGLAVLFCMVSLLALREFVFLDRTGGNRQLVWAILAVGTVAAYGALVLPLAGRVSRFIGLAMLPVMYVSMVAAGGSVKRGALALAAFLLASGGLGCVVSLSQITGPGPGAVTAGLRMVFFLLLLTGLNDVAQYLWGKGIGRTPVVPRISPKKTWAGLVGGVGTTTVLAGCIAPWLIPAGWQWGAGVGLLLGIGGFCGDLVASAYKRSVGAGESGTLLPGHGGILDRIDSLCVTAPLLYCAVLLM